MRVSEMIKNLQEFEAKHGDVECYYAVDDEGNAYHPVYFKPSKYYVDEDGEVYQLEEIAPDEESVDVEDYEPICIVN